MQIRLLRLSNHTHRLPFRLRTFDAEHHKRQIVHDVLRDHRYPVRTRNVPEHRRASEQVLVRRYTERKEAS